MTDMRGFLLVMLLKVKTTRYEAIPGLSKMFLSF